MMVDSETHISQWVLWMQCETDEMSSLTTCSIFAWAFSNNMWVMHKRMLLKIIFYNVQSLCRVSRALSFGSERTAIIMTSFIREEMWTIFKKSIRFGVPTYGYWLVYICIYAKCTNNLMHHLCFRFILCIIFPSYVDHLSKLYEYNTDIMTPFLSSLSIRLKEPFRCRISYCDMPKISVYNLGIVRRY